MPSTNASTNPKPNVSLFFPRCFFLPSFFPDLILANLIQSERGEGYHVLPPRHAKPANRICLNCLLMQHQAVAQTPSACVSSQTPMTG